MRSNFELTQQEHTVLSLVAKGWRNAAIARELSISIRTVETHVYRIFDKLGVSSRTEAALFVLNIGPLSKTKISGNSDDKVNNSNYALDIN